MKVKLLMGGVVLSGLLACLNHFTFDQPDDLSLVPGIVSAAMDVVASPLPAVLSVAQAEIAEVDVPDVKGDTDEISQEVELATSRVIEGIKTSESGEDLITISLDSAPLVDVVRMFSSISGVNIVAGTNLQGVVTVSMHDVPWEPALSAILDSVNLVLVEKDGGIFSIISKSALAEEPMAMETIFLDYTSASNVVLVVEEMLISTNGSVSAFPAANAIVVQETATRLTAIQSMIRRIDKPRPQVYIEAKFIELNDSAIENLGINWQVLRGYNVAVTPNISYTREDASKGTFEDQLEYSRRQTLDQRETYTDSSKDTRNTTLFDAEGSLDTTAGTIPSDSVDAGVFQSSLTGRNALPSLIREEDESGNITITTALDVTDPVQQLETVKNNVEETQDVDATVDSFSSIQTMMDEQTVNKLMSAVLTADELAFTLSALKETDGVEIVSNPKIIVSNGKTATIHVGRNEPNVTAVPQGDMGDRFAVGLNETNPYIEIGVKLEVTPTVNTEEYITLNIVPELSRKLGDLEVGSIGVSYPITSIRKIETEFQLKSGRTVAIGGLTETSENESINKVPVLGDIPVIGKHLFQHKSISKVQDEIVIFVTVGLAKPQTLVEDSGIPSAGELIHRHLATQAIMEAQEAAD